MQLESGGNCNVSGKTGEKGCFQFMPGTWRYWSQRVLGYVSPQTPDAERYVALEKIQYHLNEGYAEDDILLIWNQGNAGPCRAGVNSAGVSYNSCAYRDHGMHILALAN